LTRNEATLINAIAINLESQKKTIQAIETYQKCLQNLSSSRMNKKYPKRYIEFILSNLASDLGNIGNAEEAISLSKEIVKLRLQYGSGKGIAEALYEIAWNLKECGKTKMLKEESYQYVFSLAWHKAILEGNREFIYFLQNQKKDFE